jgi:hypothetical protein
VGRSPGRSTTFEILLSGFSVLPVLSTRFNMPGNQLIHRTENLLQRGGEIALLVDIAEELFGKQELTRSQRQHLELFAEMIDQISRLDCDRLGVFQLLVLLSGSAHLEAIEQNLLPVHFFFFLLLLFLLLGGGLLGGFLFGLKQLQEGVG